MHPNRTSSSTNRTDMVHRTSQVGGETTRTPTKEAGETLEARGHSTQDRDSPEEAGDHTKSGMRMQMDTSM